MAKTTTTIQGNTQKPLRADGDDSDSVYSKALWEALTHIKKNWNVSDEQLGSYLHVAKTTVNNWINKGSVPYSSEQMSNDTERLIHLIAIDRNLTSFFKKSDAKINWIHTYRKDLMETPHNLLEGKFESLLRVRWYLDFMRGRGV